jgi:hypothetical protein
MSERPPKKPWSVDQFEQHRPHLTQFAKDHLVHHINNELCKRILLHAPVKSGKREMMEYTAVRDHPSTGTPIRVHTMISAWHRTADDDQRKELKEHNITVFSITKKIAADECIHWIQEQIRIGKKVIVHLDECDHGSGERQILGHVYKQIREYNEVTIILYSATPHEVLFSGDINISEEENEMLDDMLYGIHITYEPPPEYCGAKQFLDAGLVTEATPFFTLTPRPTLTTQGREIIDGLKHAVSTNTGRNILTLRLTKKTGRTKADKDIYLFLKNSHLIPELEGIPILVDKGDCEGNFQNEHISIEKINWADKSYWIKIANHIPIIIVMDQTSSRSTEWKCHPRIFATHDYRSITQFSVLAQAQQRPNHYTSTYGGFQPIHIYGSVKTFQLSANIIGYENYFTYEWIMKKINIRRGLGEVYEIKHSTTTDRHPSYPDPVTKTEAEDILKELGCFNDVSLSARVRGTVRKLPIFETKWFQCNHDNWSEIIDIQLPTIGDGMFADRRFENPFNHPRRPPISDDGREFGYLRGWHILEYSTDIQLQPGWGVTLNNPRLTICYNNGTLGVAIRWHTGRTEESNRLITYRSMYSIHN